MGENHKNRNLMELVNMLTKDLLDNEESKVTVISDKPLCIGIVFEITIPNSSSLSQDGISQLTSPSFSDTSNQLRIELAMSKHKILKTDGFTTYRFNVGRTRTRNV